METRKPGYWTLVGEGEPFRLLFPLGTLLGIVGVLLWPAFLWGGYPYPVFQHSGVMIQGFLTSFIIGFLGTALPRLLGVRHLGPGTTLALAGAVAVVAGLHLAAWHGAAHAAFLLLLGGFIFTLLRRARKREDLPPPAFVLVFGGMACGLLGAGVHLPGAVGVELPGWLEQLGKRLLFEGYLLLPVMGVGAFLLPRFFDLPNRQALPESFRVFPKWKQRAAFAGACGGVVLVSFVFEAVGWWRAGYVLRAAAVLGYFAREVPIHKAVQAPGSLALALRLALVSIPLGYLAMACFPAWRITLVHIVFITGFSLLTFTVASRVILGHGGRQADFPRPLKSVMAVAALFVLAMATRLAADWMPELRLTHYAYAALAWAAAALVWAVRILPVVRNPDAE